jgi:hypothetical protein
MKIYKKDEYFPRLVERTCDRLKRTTGCKIYYEAMVKAVNVPWITVIASDDKNKKRIPVNVFMPNIIEDDKADAFIEEHSKK